MQSSHHKANQHTNFKGFLRPQPFNPEIRGKGMIYQLKDPFLNAF